MVIILTFAAVVGVIALAVVALLVWCAMKSKSTKIDEDFPASKQEEELRQRRRREELQKKTQKKTQQQQADATNMTDHTQDSSWATYDHSHSG